MIGLIIGIHVIACILLIGIILIQAGRGGGLVENLSSMESMFGTKTNALLTKSTTVLSIVFFITCLSLALLSARQSRSLLMRAAAAEKQSSQPAVAQKADLENKVPAPLTKPETTKPEATKTE